MIETFHSIPTLNKTSLYKSKLSKILIAICHVHLFSISPNMFHILFERIWLYKSSTSLWRWWNENIYMLPRGVDFPSLINREDGIGAEEMPIQMWILSLKLKENSFLFYYFCILAHLQGFLFWCFLRSVSWKFIDVIWGYIGKWPV